MEKGVLVYECTSNFGEMTTCKTWEEVIDLRERDRERGPWYVMKKYIPTENPVSYDPTKAIAITEECDTYKKTKKKHRLKGQELNAYNYYHRKEFLII